MNVQMSLVHEVQRVFVYFFRKQKRQKQFIEILGKLRHRWGRYLLFVDGAKAHSGAKVRVYLKKHRKTIKIGIFSKMLTRRESNRTMLETWKKWIGKQGYSLIERKEKHHLWKTFDNAKVMPSKNVPLFKRLL